MLYFLLTVIFQSTLPRRTRPTDGFVAEERNIFQSTLPRRKRPSWIIRRSLPKLFQSTLPRRKRPVAMSQRVICRISIHASAKEATQLHDHLPAYSIISIHASAKEATHCKLWLRHLRINFNPRFREGSDFEALYGGAAGGGFQSTLPRRKRRSLSCKSYK